MATNFYGLTGGATNANIYPTQPTTFTATGTDGDTITLGWDDSAADYDMCQIQYSVGEAGEGTVTTEAGVNVIGVGSNFTEFAVGDWILVAGNARKIASITDDENLVVSVAYGGVEAAAPYAISTTWVDLACLDIDVEAYVHEPLEAESPYFYRLRSHKRFKWSDWTLVDGALTTA